MSFLLNRDACLAVLRGVRAVARRCTANAGVLHVSAVTIMGVELWLLQPSTPVRQAQGYQAMIQAYRVVAVDDAVAHRAAMLGHALRRQGHRLNTVNLLVAATALEHGLTLITHDGQRFAHIPGLTVVDWTAP